MTSDLLRAVLERCLDDEGAVSEIDADPGGLTAYGLTAPFLRTVTLRDWTPDEIRAITREKAYSIYKLWAAMRRLDQLPENFLFAWIVIDFAIHSGDRQSIRAVQRSLGIPADGIAGADTQGAWHRLSPDELRVMAMKVIADRMELLGGAITRNPALGMFAKGWMRRVAAQVRACA